MAAFQLSSLALSSSSSSSIKTLQFPKPLSSFSRGKRITIRAVSTVPDSDSESAAEPNEPPIKLVFVAPVLLPDCTLDMQNRTACSGENLRRIMLDANIELYGPYARVLLNCAGGGCCATCMVEVVQGRELLSPRTDKEKEKLNRKPKNWRLACQTTLKKSDSDQTVVIQQMPEWKAHEWTYKRIDGADIDKFYEDNLS